MKKVDQNQKVIEPQFSDADYQDDMRVDPLTTSERIREELSEIESNKNARENELKKAEAEKQKLEREEFELWKAQQAEKAENGESAK